MSKCEGCECQSSCGGSRDYSFRSLATQKEFSPESLVPLVCYLAGRMQGEWRFNEAAFTKGAASLRAVGLSVVSPLEIDFDEGYVVETPSGDLAHAPDFDYESVLGNDLKIVENVDFVALLPGWKKSPGANREVDHARFIGVPCYEIVWH